MDIAVEISLYPLQADFVPIIKEFIARLNAHPRLKVLTNSMSTQVSGAYEDVMQMLQQELRTSFAALAPQGRKAVFVMKVLGPLAPG
jgi:uncharacterized protein YqgV (UPF0045/DUF77 family)